MLEQFKADVDEGLSSQPKFLSSKYFYDKLGDDLFVQIMNLPEYYLTRAEMDIFQNQTDALIEAIHVKTDTNFELIELGAGDGTKTKKLLSRLLEKGYAFEYFPIDISQNALNQLEDSLKREMPQLNVNPQQGDYFNVLSSLKPNQKPKVILFLGSNIGNMIDERASAFIYQLGENVHTGDKLVLGVDLIKSEEIVLPAYNDASGVTRAFNLNILKRINDQLGANFILEQFDHAPEYSEETGIAKSYIMSLADQVVHIESLDTSYDFKAGEKIQTEISRKYNDDILANILKLTDFKIIEKLSDRNGYFADYIIEKQFSE